MSTLAVLLHRALASGSVASLLSYAVVAWAARRDCGSAFAGINAPSHWLWGDRALRTRRPSVRHTAIGLVIHHLSSLFWASFFESAMRGRERSVASAALPAAGIATLAYVVDFQAVPERLTPGFQRNMQPRHLYVVYAAFAVGLALGASARRN